MKKILSTTTCLFIIISLFAQSGKVGINTTSPQAMLHVSDSSVVFTAGNVTTSGFPPVSGSGVRMMWYAQKAAFRAGRATGENWDKDSIGFYSFAIGEGTKAKGAHSFAMGQLSNSSGFASFAAGASVSATGRAAVSMGSNSHASGDNSIALGEETIARSFASLSIGRYNNSIISSNLNSWVDTDPVFIIGNGSDDNDRNNAMIVLKNAKTGINTSSPDAMLHIVTNGASGGGYHSKAALIVEDNTDSYIQFSNPGADENGLLSGSNVSDIRSGIIFRPDSSINFRAGGNTTRMLLTKTGDVTIGGILTQNSDAILKKNIQPLQNSLQKILTLGGYHYNWIEDSGETNLQTGLLAQEIEKQMPELVRADEKGIKSVNYSGMIPYLIEAIKVQQQTISNQQQRIDLLEEQINKLLNTAKHEQKL